MTPVLAESAAPRSRTQRQSILKQIMGMPAGAIFLVFMTLQIVCIAGALLYPDEFRYLSPQNLTILMKAIPVLGCLALGAGVLMIAGEFDLSIGSVYTFTAVLMASLVNAGLSAFIAAPIGILTGLLIGSLNGHITLRFACRPSSSHSAGSSSGAARCCSTTVPSRAFRPGAGLHQPLFRHPVRRERRVHLDRLFVIGFHLLLHRHRFGNHVFATGGNRGAAEAIGINTSRVKLIAFAIAGGMAAVAGILATARVGSVQPGQGAGLELQAIAACVIGGLSLRGGRGSIIGIFLGVLLIHTITDVLLLLRAPGFYLDMFIATLIVLAAIFNHLIERRGLA